MLPLNHVIRNSALLRAPRRHRAAQHRLDVLERVIALPGQPVGVVPFRARHARMCGADVIEVVLVEVGSSARPARKKLQMILRARQRRQVEELQQSTGSSCLITSMSCRIEFDGVVREAEDVAGIGDDAGLLPGEQHLAVFGDLVLPLLGAEQVVRIDVLQPDENPLNAGARAFLDEVRQLVAQRVDLDDEAEN